MDVRGCYILQRLIENRFGPYSRYKWRYAPVVHDLHQKKEQRDKGSIDAAFIPLNNNMPLNELYFKTRWNPWTQFLCINDEIVDGSSEEAKMIVDFVREKLEKRFPTKSAFEK